MSNLSRISQIRIKNFKNIKFGCIRDLNYCEDQAALLGLFGPNGTGKTALVDACRLLKFVISGLRIPDQFTHVIGSEQESSELMFSFIFNQNEDPETPQNLVVEYVFKITKQQKFLASPSGDGSGYQIKIFDEVIKISSPELPGYKQRKILIDSSKNNSYTPLSLVMRFTQHSPLIDEELRNLKYFAQNSALSAIFNDRIMEILSKNKLLKRTLSVIKHYGKSNLYVITTADQNLFSWSERTVPLQNKVQIPFELIESINQSVTALNAVLQSLIPDITLQLTKKNITYDAKGREICNFDLYSIRNGIRIPLDFESNGIKKLLRILEMIICVYNRSDVTTIIDELDTGIFEYLLGELLTVIAEKGKGQLIFTSHDLRPLELLNKKYLCFTTANPANRFIRIKGISKNTNIRDFYFRKLQLWNQNNPLYEGVDHAKLAHDLYKAGHNGSL